MAHTPSFSASLGHVAVPVPDPDPVPDPEPEPEPDPDPVEGVGMKGLGIGLGLGLGLGFEPLGGQVLHAETMVKKRMLRRRKRVREEEGLEAIDEGGELKLKTLVRELKGKIVACFFLLVSSSTC